jgi:predicted RND superfamily exporter protein
LSWTNATITCFYKDYNNELIHEAIAKAKAFIEANPMERIRFRLAGGLLGVLAAVNEEVEYSYWASLIAVFVVVFLLCVVSFRSFMAGFVLIIPLAISQILCEAFMLWKGIDMNINSLPVAAIAVGIGIDYGIYLVARISEEYQETGDYTVANRRAVETTGRAIIFTATTLVAGVIFWVFIDLKFQAEMGLLLGLLMFLNMVNALVFIPSLVTIFKPRFVVERKI